MPQDKTCERPTVVLVIGMAGAGKTSLMAQIEETLKRRAVASTPSSSSSAPSSGGYLVNLDPAVANLSYEPQIDIRDTV